MNLNKVLIGLFCVLVLLVVVTVINLNRSKNPRFVYEIVDDEVLMSNIWCVPEIVRSYEKTKLTNKKKNILFFRYVKNTCNTCLDSQLNELLTFQEEVGKEYVWIYPAYPNDRNSLIQLSNELAKYNYENFPADSFLIPTYNGEPKSYFAWINDEGKIDLVFVPDRNNVQHTRHYFLEVKKIIQMIEKN